MDTHKFPSHRLTLMTNMGDWHWRVREWTIEDMISNPMICSLSVVHTIPANILGRIFTRPRIYFSTIYFYPYAHTTHGWNPRDNHSKFSLHQQILQRTTVISLFFFPTIGSWSYLYFILHVTSSRYHIGLTKVRARAVSR